ncbi:MAG TPA: TonB family protein [Vicinamibacterales bacterium]|nr:TonB family protein [Vicinamibacterales bacterium]
MYFDFWDNRPDTPRLSSPMTPREKGLVTVVVHLLLVILILVWPEIPWVKEAEARRQQELEAAEQRRLELQKQQEEARFVFMQPRVEMRATPPPRAELSDLDRRANSVERPVEARNPLPFARGNTPERIDSEPVNGPRAQPEPAPAPAPGANGESAGDTPALRDSTNGLMARAVETPKPAAAGPSTGILADAIRNVQKYAGQEAFHNPQGGAPNENYPSIQFDAKGVEFGPWLRRFVAQIRRNWFIPYAAMTMKGHVVVTFYVHKDGRITDLTVVKPSSIEAFTNSAHNALAASNPTVPLPPEYPDDRAFFTVTFYFNETPPR